ncbi:hypothetical protein JMJ35_010150 [Cladonia borealis]|uniref:Rhodopsin domain-containing protein n=1 Tax=Cladonia borealis TaxID=184061 RepID=A0AA39UXQ5_9LECA|nr:hypothetical protein JMJ35_010150 [Cladonia borealis]
MTQSNTGISGPGRTFIAINIVFILLVSVVVAARFWSRNLKKTLYGWDDWTILAALIVYYGQGAFNFWVVVKGGLGYHAIQVTKPELENTFLQLTVSQFLYAVNFVLIRFSICFLLLRLFPQRWLVNTVSIASGLVRVAMGVNVAWGLFVIISALTVCMPFAYNWNTSIPGGHCNDSVKLNTYIVNSVWTIVYDSVMCAIPQGIVWRLQMPLATKAGLSMIFALGIFDIAISIVRITTVVNVDLTDVTYTDSSSQIWSLVEISVAIIVACLPVCRTVIERAIRLFPLPYYRKYRGTTNTTARTDSYNRSIIDDGAPSRLRGYLPDAYRRFDEESDAMELTTNVRPPSTTTHSEFPRNSIGSLTDTSGRPVKLDHATDAKKATGKSTVAAELREQDGVGSSNAIAVQHDITVTYGS